MCTSCVDRLFTSGPAPCPVAGCHKTLRKRGFHKAFFADLTIEREVDVRRRVSEVFNKRQDDFESLRDWNDYLQEVEDLIFEIVNGTEKEKKRAEERLEGYKKANLREIEENKLAEREMADEEKRREYAQMEAVRRRRERAAKESREEKEMVERTKRNVLERLATGDGNAEEIARQAERAIGRAQEKIRGDGADAGTAAPSGLTIRGLKQRKQMVLDKPYDPFGGVDLTPTRYVLQEEYSNEWLDMAKTDGRHMAGGYSLQEYYARTMFEAFSGLGVFIEDEVEGRDEAAAPQIATGAALAAAEAGTTKDVDEVF